MFCARCGKEIKITDKYCAFCGEKADYSSEFSFDVILEKCVMIIRNNKMIVMAAVIVMVLFLLWMFSRSNDNEMVSSVRSDTEKDVISSIVNTTGGGLTESDIEDVVKREMNANDYCHVKDENSFFSIDKIDNLEQIDSDSEKQKYAADIYAINAKSQVMIPMTFCIEKDGAIIRLYNEDLNGNIEYRSLNGLTAEDVIICYDGAASDLNYRVGNIDEYYASAESESDVSEGEYAEATLTVDVETDIVSIAGDIAATFRWNSYLEEWEYYEEREKENFEREWHFDGTWSVAAEQGFGWIRNYYMNIQRISDTEYAVGWYYDKIDAAFSKMYRREGYGQDNIVIDFDAREFEIEDEEFYFDYSNIYAVGKYSNTKDAMLERIDEIEFDSKNLSSYGYILPFSNHSIYGDFCLLYYSMSKESVEYILDTELQAGDCGTSIPGLTCYESSFSSEYCNKAYFFFREDQGLMAIYINANPHGEPSLFDGNPKPWIEEDGYCEYHYNQIGMNSYSKGYWFKYNEEENFEVLLYCSETPVNSWKYLSVDE